jgi:hypothetical protein
VRQFDVHLADHVVDRVLLGQLARGSHDIKARFFSFKNFFSQKSGRSVQIMASSRVAMIRGFFYKVLTVVHAQWSGTNLKQLRSHLCRTLKGVARTFGHPAIKNDGSVVRDLQEPAHHTTVIQPDHSAAYTPDYHLYSVYSGSQQVSMWCERSKAR